MKFGCFLLVIGLAACSPQSPEESSVPPKPDASYRCEEIYLGLRAQALAIGGTGAVEGVDADGVLVLLMETGYPEAIASLVLAADGSTSLYFSNGGGMLGAGGHEDVAALSKQALRTVVGHMDQMVVATEPMLPARGEVRFHVVTRSGVKTLGASQEDLGENGHEASPLFFQCHEVIAAIRKHDGGT